MLIRKEKSTYETQVLFNISNQYGWQHFADVALGYLAKSWSTVPVKLMRFFVAMLFALAQVVRCTL